MFKEPLAHYYCLLYYVYCLEIVHATRYKSNKTIVMALYMNTEEKLNSIEHLLRLK